ncbi:hypothetical protein Tco_0396719 [Tanacetum coccineum]
MSMLEDRSNYINVSESAQDTDGEVNPTHAYYNSSRTSQDIEYPSWSTSIKTRRQRRHLQHWKRVGCHFIMLYLFLLGTFMDWKKLDNDNLPRESIRFKCSSQVVVGRLIFWGGHERFVSDDGHVVFKKHLIVSFDLIGYSFQVYDIDAVFRDGLTIPKCLSSLGNSLILSGSMDETDFYLFVSKVVGTLVHQVSYECGGCYQYILVDVFFVSNLLNFMVV